MVTLNIKDNYFDYIEKNSDCKIIVYGAGHEARKKYKYIGHIDYFCDKVAENIDLIENIPCILPKDLLKIQDKMIILICVKEKKIVDQICLELGEMPINAEFFWFFRNPAFSCESPYSDLLILLPVIKSKIAEKECVNILDISEDAEKNFISLMGCFDSEHLKYYIVEENKVKGGCLDKEISELLKQADICLLTGSQICICSEIVNSNSGVEYIFIAKYLPETVEIHKTWNRRMYESGYNVCLDLLQSGAQENEPGYRGLLYQIRQ